jgi:hypothetical protein
MTWAFELGDVVEVHRPGYGNHGRRGVVIGFEVGGVRVAFIEVAEGQHRHATIMADYLRRVHDA